jgi:SOS-response transcriptional repressor LexA
MSINHSAEFSLRLEQALNVSGAPPKGKGRLLSVAKLFGISQQAAAKWLNGTIFPTKRINSIADKLNVNPHWLLTGQGNMNPHSQVLVAPGTPVLSKAGLGGYNWQQVPIISWKQAGNWHSENITSSQHSQCIWATTETKNLHFALIVEDDSMQPRFFPGNILIFDPSLKPRHKNRILIRWKSNSQIICGVLILHGPSQILKPHNPDYKPIALDNADEFEFIAVCRQVFIVDILEEN